MGALTLAAATVFFLLGLARPAWAVAIVILMFPLEQLLQASSSVFLARPYLGNVMVGGLALLTATRLSIAGRGALHAYWTPTLLATVAIYAYAALSLVWTFAPEYLRESILHTTPYFVVFIFLAPAIISDIRELKELRIAILLMGATIATLIVLNPNFAFHNTRFVLAMDASERSNPLEIGALGGILVVAAALGSPRDGLFIFVVRGGAFFIGLGLGFLSGSRGEVLAAILVSILFLPVARKIANIRQFLITASLAGVIGVGIIVIQGLFVGLDNRDRWSVDDMLYGGSGRLENLLDLAANYLRNPAMWLTGLGSAAFHDLPTSSGDPYSHVLLADLPFELGLPGLVLGAIIFVTAGKSARQLIRWTRADPALRSGVGFFVGMTVFEFIIANKAGNIWGNTDLFCCCCILTRVCLLAAGTELPLQAMEAEEGEALGYGLTDEETEAGVPALVEE